MTEYVRVAAATLGIGMLTGMSSEIIGSLTVNAIFDSPSADSGILDIESDATLIARIGLRAIIAAVAIAGGDYINDSLIGNDVTGGIFFTLGFFKASESLSNDIGMLTKRITNSIISMEETPNPL